MVSASSLPVEGNAIFDLESQAGVMHLLASVRTSDTSPQQKSELRDLVFLYTNGGKDQSVRLSLEQKIAAYRVQPIAKKSTITTPPPQPPQPTIGKYRVAPVFVPAPIQTAVPRPSAPAPNFQADAAWVPKSVVSTPEPVVPQPSLQQEPLVHAVTTAPVVEISVPQPVSVPAAQSSAPSVPVAASQTPVADTGEYLTRIREIKAAVNEKVGNPVNLVDINNEVGREYMGALLDAMKKINSGSSAASAMKRLEDSYTAVLKALETHEASGSTPSVAASEMSVAPVAVSAPIASPEPIVTPEQEPAPYPVVASAEPIQSYQAELVSRISISQSAPAVAPTSHFTAPQETVRAQDPEEKRSVPSTPMQSSGFASLADLKKPHTLEDLQAGASLKSTAATTGDPLFSKEVDDGLEQLLSEWVIFKKSGLFGTGPKGYEHPLFKKIAPLHIPLLLAGRFEGATQEIKQSITDYMNGWRYEQGIIYQQGETFEHYLRRVIRHILDLQKGQ
jgi:hypothetical protein